MRPRHVTEILQRHALAHRIAFDQLLGPSREAPFVAARRDAMLELRARGYSLPQIGRWIGGMHHTTVMYHVGKMPPKPVDTAIPVPDYSGEWAI